MNILMCTDEEFAPAAAAALKSFCAFNDARATQVFIFHEGLSVATREAIAASVPEISTITFLAPGVERFAAIGVPLLNNQYSTYLRLLAGDVLPRTVDKIVYIDSDVLVLDSIQALWRMPCDGSYVLAALDDCLSGPGAHRSALLDRFGMQDSKRKQGYFNAGVLLLNLERWRDTGFLDRLMEIATANPQGLQLHDQDLLNLGVGDDWEVLPRRWNLQTYGFFEDQACAGDPRSKQHERLLGAPGILHFTGSTQKPWMNSCRHPYQRVFRHYLDQTRFADWSRVERPTLSSMTDQLVNMAKDRLRARVWCSGRFRRDVERRTMR